MIRMFTTIIFSILMVDFAAAETAKLKMRFVFDGVAPSHKQINLAPAFAPPGGPLIDERLLVDPKSNGIKNVLVYVYTGRGGSKFDLPQNQNPSQKRLLTLANGRFDPHILITQAGDTLELIAQGPNQYKPFLSFFANMPQEILISPGTPWLIPVPKPEPAPMPVDCHIHPWMRAYVVVLDHPFAAVTDSDGKLAIDGLPTGKSITFRVFHEAGRIDRVRMSSAETDWQRGRFNVELAAGVNDLGDILISSESLTH